jgi:hypothetical protein
MRQAGTLHPELPSWLPTNMRCTATPTERLQTLLSTLKTLAQNHEFTKLRIRAAKIQHLCLQLKPGMEARIPAAPVRQRELLEVFSLSAAFLESMGRAAKPNDAVISSIYVCATLLRRQQDSAAIKVPPRRAHAHSAAARR